MDKKVLIVDDEKHIRFAVCKILKPEGIEVSSAASGEEGLEELRKGFRGVILMDIMMPERDGWDTIREMVNRGYYEGNVLMMLTAVIVPSEKMEGLQEYVLSYITKPFDREELVQSVSRGLSYLSPLLSYSGS